MTEEKISIEKIAEKHTLDEEIVDNLFYYWDVNSWNDVEHTLNEIAKKLSSEQYIHFLIDVLTREVYCQPVDVRLLLASLVEEGVLNAEDGIYRLNHNKENDKLFQECLSYKE